MCYYVTLQKFHLTEKITALLYAVRRKVAPYQHFSVRLLVLHGPAGE